MCDLFDHYFRWSPRSHTKTLVNQNMDLLLDLLIHHWYMRFHDRNGIRDLLVFLTFNVYEPVDRNACSRV